MDAAALAKNLAFGRILIGGAMCAAPASAAGWIGRDAKRDGAQVAIRALGVRDAMLGVGVVMAADEPADLRRWLLASSVSDVVDFAATLSLRPSARRSGVLALAASAGLANLALAALARD